MLPFKKAKTSRIFQHVVQQVQDAILDGSLKAGDVLPSEMKLKEMFETSRGTIREALRVLEQKGLIDIRTGVGGGAVVRSVDTEKITEDLDLLLQYRKVTYDHLAEFREGVEGLVAALAAERATPKDLDLLEALLAEARQLLDSDASDNETLVRIDMRLHIALAQIARNPIYLANLQMVHERILGDYERFSLSRRRVLEENYRDLAELVDAVGNGDALKASKLAKRHVRRFNRYLKQEHPRPNGTES